MLFCEAGVGAGGGGFTLQFSKPDLIPLGSPQGLMQPRLDLVEWETTGNGSYTWSNIAVTNQKSSLPWNEAKAQVGGERRWCFALVLLKVESNKVGGIEKDERWCKGGEERHSEWEHQGRQLYSRQVNALLLLPLQYFRNYNFYRVSLLGQSMESVDVL